MPPELKHGPTTSAPYDVMRRAKELQERAAAKRHLKDSVAANVRALRCLLDPLIEDYRKATTEKPVRYDHLMASLSYHTKRLNDPVAERDIRQWIATVVPPPNLQPSRALRQLAKTHSFLPPTRFLQADYASVEFRVLRAMYGPLPQDVLAKYAEADARMTITGRYPNNTETRSLKHDLPRGT